MVISNKMAETVVLKSFSAPVWLKFETIGYTFRQHVHHMVNGHVTTASNGSSDDTSTDSDGDIDGDTGSSVIDHSTLDPTQWKDQDHYSILGLSKSRYKASPKEIRKAYQQQALLHHPDKQETKGDDTLFKCIQVAYEILGNPKKRLGYDSVDPTFNDTIPKQSAANSGDQFYQLFSAAFESNARWSTIQPVPSLGVPDAEIDYVEKFYSFWYDFNSWREFSYLDEENTAKAENRDERRWMEKQNKAVRQKKKKEETARIRTLVDNAYSCDPRVKKFKEIEREKKEAQKRAKEEAAKEEARKKEEEKKKKEEKERLVRERKEEEERKVQLQQKQERDVVRKALKKERKQLRTICKEQKYFLVDESQTLERMQQIERLCETLTIESLAKLNEELAAIDSIENGGQIIDREITVLKEKEEEEERKAEEMRRKASLQKGMVTGDGAAGNWNRDEAQLLIKAVNLYPAGTSRRWQVIADYINQHNSSVKGTRKTAEQVVAKVKVLKKMDGMEKEIENKKAFDSFKEQQSFKTGKVASATPTERDVSDVTKPWSAEEQKLLESAIRTCPPSTPKRWDRIAELVTTRTKEECVKRFKELVAKVKSKKQLL